MKAKVSIRSALADPQLLGNALPGESHRLWRIILIALCGEELTEGERVEFKAITGRDCEPGERIEEFWGIVGRRGGKTKAMATLASYLACLCDYDDVLAPGERGVIPILSASIVQSRSAFLHVSGVLNHSPMLSTLIKGETKEEIQLTTGIDIAIRPANFKTIRGITAVAVINDEIAFWSVEGFANPDSEILDAVRPALATTGGPLISISSFSLSAASA